MRYFKKLLAAGVLAYSLYSSGCFLLIREAALQQEVKLPGNYTSSLQTELRIKNLAGIDADAYSLEAGRKDKCRLKMNRGEYFPTEKEIESMAIKADINKDKRVSEEEIGKLENKVCKNFLNNKNTMKI
ncbi:MAG: hypothetical protein WC413_02505 [Candidatus Nanoarchaeia archaeon]